MRFETDVFLGRMLAAALRRHVDQVALDDLEQCLLHALAGDVPRNRRVVALLACDLVDLVDVDDAHLCPFDVPFGGVEQAHQHILHVLAHVAGLGQIGGVGDGEGNVENAGQSLRQEGLTAAGGADQHDVAFLKLDIAE